MACGGYPFPNTQCWALGDGTYSWVALPNSNQEHCYSDTPNLIVDDGWWLTGRQGFGGGAGCLPNEASTSEILTGEGGKGPHARIQVAQVFLNATLVFYKFYILLLPPCKLYHLN